MGVFEMDKFAAGTFAVVDALVAMTEGGAVTIVGGGDSVAAVEKSGKASQLSHISTGGGASLELLEGKVLPGVAALDEEATLNDVASPSGSGMKAVQALKAEANISKLEL